MLRRMRSLPLLVPVLAAGLGPCAAGCASPVVIDEAVLSYDKALSRVRSELLLLNVARARAGLPLNGSEVSGVTASFEFEASTDVTGGIAPLGVAEGAAGGLELGVTARATEAPTLSIVPLQGEAFTRRLLEPIPDRTFEFLHHRGVRLGLLLRLLGQAFVLEVDPAPDGASTRTVIANDPAHREQFFEFRRRVDVLDELARAGRLELGPIARREEWRPPADAGLEDLTHMLDHGFELVKDAQGPLLFRRVEGRILLSSYDPDLRSEAERAELAERARLFPPGFVLVDVAPAAGEQEERRLRGWLKLRSLQQVLDFVARGIDPTYEDLLPPRVPGAIASAPQPVRTLIVLEAPSAPDDAAVAVELHGRWYSLPPLPPGAPAMDDWNHRAFTVLMDLWQLTTRSPGAPLPALVSVGGGRE